MCRLLSYIGQRPICLADLIKKPKNSLIAQSRSTHAERPRLNADGFGLGWYNLPLGPEAAVYRSTQPVWNDRNLHHFIEKTESQLFIAHIRASTVGVVSEANCHPFSYGAYMMAHNGTIKNFSLIKRALLAQLPEHLFLAIQGTTDSECLFYLIISFLEQGDTSLPEAIAAAIGWVATAQETLSDESYSKINLIFSDGHRIVAAKYASKAQKCHSLVIGRHPLTGGVVISSEIVGFNKKNWHQIPDNSIISVLKQEEVWAIEPYERYLLRKMD